MTQPVNVQSVLGPGQDGVSAQPNTGPGYEGGGKFDWSAARPFDDTEYPDEPGPRKWVANVPGSLTPLTGHITWEEHRTAVLSAVVAGDFAFWDDFAPLTPVAAAPQPPYLYAGYMGVPLGFSHWFSGKTVTVQENGDPIMPGSTATFVDGFAGWEDTGYDIFWGASTGIISGGSGYDPANPPNVCAELFEDCEDWVSLGTACVKATVSAGGEVTGVVGGFAEAFIAGGDDCFTQVVVTVDPPPPAAPGATREITDTSPTGHTHFLAARAIARMAFARVFAPQYAGALLCRYPLGDTEAAGILGPHSTQINWLNDPLSVPELDDAEQFEGRLREYWTGAFLGTTGAAELIPFDYAAPTYVGGATWDEANDELDYSIDNIAFQEVDWPGGWVVEWRLETHADNPEGSPPFTDAIYAATGIGGDHQWWVPYGVEIPAQPTYGNGVGPYIGVRITADVAAGAGFTYFGLYRINEPTHGPPVTPFANVTTSIATTRGDTCPYVLPVQGAGAGTI